MLRARKPSRADGGAALAARALAACLALVAGAATVALTAPSRALAAPGAAGTALPVTWRPTSWWLRLRTTGYAFQTEPILGTAVDRFGAYQSFDGAASGLADGRIAFRASGRFADDLYLEDRSTDRARLFTGYVEVRPGARTSARLGRQFLQEGGTGLTLDGLLFEARSTRRWDAKVWGGARAPLSRKIEAGDLGDDAAAGVRIGARPGDGVRVAASWAYRERAGRVGARPLGLEAGLAPARGPLAGVALTGRVAYDLEREVWDRAEALARWATPVCPTVVTAQFVDRMPAVDAASYFARFAAAERIRAARTTVRYEHRSRVGAEVEYVGAFVDERTSARVGGALLLPVGRVGYSARVGDAGDESRWHGDVSFDALPWLSVDAGATFATYALLEDAPESDEHDLTTLFGRIRARPRPGLGATLEVQSVEGPVYSEDVRVLAGLDLTIGRGAGRFGLDRGGWLP